MNTWRRKILALLSVPLLAVPSAAGVYLWLVPHIGAFFAGLTAAGFESLYIGINVLIITTPELRRYARNVALSGVATAVIFNTLARYQAMVCPPLSAAEIARGIVSSCTLRTATFDGIALGLAVLESIPLAGLAYAISVLLHRLSEASALPLRPIVALHRSRLARSLWRLRSEARSSRAARASEASGSVMLAQARADLESVRALLASQGNELAQALIEAAQANADRESWQQQATQNEQDAARAVRDAEQHFAGESAALRELARLESEVAQLRASSALASQSAARLESEVAQRAHDRREFDQVSAQLREEVAIARAAAGLDMLAVVRRMLSANVPLREIAPLVGVHESTLRSRLKAATNGHAIEAPAE